MINSTIVKERENPAYQLYVSNDFMDITVLESDLDKTLSAQFTFKKFDVMGFTLHPEELTNLLKNAQAGFSFEGYRYGISKSISNLDPTYYIWIYNVNITATEEEMQLYKELINIIAEKISKRMILNKK
ncbi:hypothetical protein [Viridibacillus arvi]|uniref:hypothetical protein n=1 Tax=Viridibacillus arvi TaxID=263475 RepID=UPI0034CEAEAC